MKLNWNYPTTVWVGQDRVGDLVDACINLNINKYKMSSYHIKN